MIKLVPTIGIEVHAELKTKSKVFSNAANSYGEVSNSKTNVVDLGYPGTLPVLNKEVINLAIKACLAMHCDIAPKMYFDRKNYFYPDLPKGYQITQAVAPIGTNGYIEIEVNGLKKKIGIERLHIEEDTSKSIHEGESTLLDFNRAGIPLIEIVTKPVIESAEEAVLYLNKLREVLLYAEISDVKIEEGSMRCDANISLKPVDSDILGTKTEIKNIGSISSVKAAINYEIERQKQILDNGEVIIEHTRRYDEKKAQTIMMRAKESNNDYRYMPEPDIPNIFIDEDWINNLKDDMPLLPDELREKYQALNINNIAIQALIAHKDVASFLKDILKTDANPVISANLLTGDVLAYLNKNNVTLDKTKLSETDFIKLVKLIDKGDISSKMGKELLGNLLINDDSIDDLIKKGSFNQISDSKEIIIIIDNVLNNNQSVVQDFNSGNERALKFLIGQVMKESKGQVNPTILNDLIIEELSKM